MSSRTSNRMKEEERIERIIRNLLKLPENRRCINCNSLGPQYVCTTFWTFVCTNCSGVHREFTHRVKSVSMAKFNAEEVSALEAGGNERARQIYFKEWDPQRHSFPDGSNQNRLRDFIKHVYVDRKFAGDRSTGKLAMVRSGANEDSSERPSFERPSPVRRIDDRSSKYYIEERRSPRNKPDSVRSGHRNRPAHFEIVDDRFRDDGYGSGRRYETHRSSNEESRTGSRSPVSQKSRDKTSPPVVRQVRDLLGENVPRVQVGGSPKANDRRDAESSGHGQKTASPRDPGSVDAKSPEHKTVNSVSLIDFSAEPELPNPAAAAQTQQTALAVEGGNVASDPQTVNSLESLLFGLSAPTSGPIDIMSEAPGNLEPQLAAPVALSNSVGANVTESTTSKPAAPGTGDVPAASPAGMELMLLSSNDSNVGVADGRQLPITQQSQFYSSPSGDSISTHQLATPSVGALYNQSWTSSVAPNAQASSSAPAEESSQPSSDAAHDTTSGVGSQPLPVEAKSCGMKELSADIFTSSYSSFPAPVPSWQIRPPHGMGYHMQYHPHAGPVPAFPNSARSRNPFDLNDDSTEAQVPMFPSMLPMQGALPNLTAPSALLHSSDAHSSHLMQPQASAYASIASPHMPYGMSLAPGAFNEQQLHNRMPFSGSQNTNGATRSDDAFASLNPIHQPSSRYPAPTTTTTNSFSSAGGNPFG